MRVICFRMSIWKTRICSVNNELHIDESSSKHDIAIRKPLCIPSSRCTLYVCAFKCIDSNVLKAMALILHRTEYNKKVWRQWDYDGTNGNLYELKDITREMPSTDRSKQPTMSLYLAWNQCLLCYCSQRATDNTFLL